MSKPACSLVVTTYGGETYHTQHCLGRLRRWKDTHTEVIVVTHDETPLLRSFLELCRKMGLVDKLLLAAPGHGHVRGLNLGFAHASADVVFNVCIDMRVGGDLVEECAALLRREERLGLIGWHYDWSKTFEGTFWRDGSLAYALRKYDDSRSAGELDAEHVASMRSAEWFTGRVFEAIGTRRILCFNGSFFGVRKKLWDRLGGFDERRYPNHWADDFFEYAVLDQGLDVANLPAPVRCGGRPESFEALTDLGWQGRPDPFKAQDRIDWTPAREIARLTRDEVTLLEVLERCLEPESAVAVLGDVPWKPTRGADKAFAGGGAHPGVELLLASRAAYHPGVERALASGGTLVVFDAPAEAGLQRVGSLGVLRNDPERISFARRSA